MDAELTRTSRLSAMLIVAAVTVPVLALAGILILRRYALVHYTTRTLALWLVFDAVIFAAGLILRENALLAKAPIKPNAQRAARKTRNR